MGQTISLPELDVPRPASAPYPDALAEFARASQLKTQAAQQQQLAAQTQGIQQQNQAQGLQLQDEMLRRQLAPQFVQKDENGKPNGFDTEGLYNAMLAGGADPMSIQAMRMKQVEMQKALLGLNDAQIEHQQKINGVLVDGIESVRDANEKALQKQNGGATVTPPAPAAAPGGPTASSMGPAVPGTNGMPAGMLPNDPAAQKLMQQPPVAAPEIGAAPAGTPVSMGVPESGTAPTGTETALQKVAEAPKPITPEAQAAYQKFLVRASSMGIPVGQFKPVLTDTSDLDQAEAGAGLHAELLNQQKKQADIAEAQGKGAQAQAAAAKDQWVGSDGTFVNIKSGQVIHAGGSPSLQAFQEYVAKGGDPLNFATDQAAREESNPALQAAKLHDTIATKAAEQAIADGDPKAAAQLLTQGIVAPSQLISSRKPAFAQAAFTAAEQMQPGWNAQKAEGDFKVASSPAQVAFFGSAKSLTDPGGTLDQLKAAAKDIPQNQIPVFNTVADAVKASTGSGPVAKYAALALGVADDYSKVMGGGQGSDTSRSQAINLIAAKQSPEQRDASIEGIRGAVASQTNSRIGSNPVLRKMYGGEAPVESKTQHVPGGKAAGLTEGQTGTGSDGKKYIVKNGVWVPQP
jgi:hypothetical protein